MIEFNVSGSLEGITRDNPLMRTIPVTFQGGVVDPSIIPPSSRCRVCDGTGVRGGPTRYEQVADSSFEGESNTNHVFNEMCYSIFDSPTFIDLGCAGGGYIREVIDDGYLGIGVDGFSAFKQNGIDGWSKHPDHFFQLNIAKPITVESGGVPLKFDVVTAWEVAEHLYEDEIDPFVKNLANLVTDEGLIIITVSLRDDRGHFTLKPEEWWEDILINNGLIGAHEYCKFFMGNNMATTNLIRACHESRVFFIRKNTDPLIFCPTQS